MLRSLFRFLPIALGLTLHAYAEHHDETEHAGVTDRSTSLFKATFLGNYGFTTGHVIALAEAIPAEKYTWSPAAGVRSVEKAILHIAATNYMLGSKLGATLPDGLDPMKIEGKNHDKQAALETLIESIEFAKHAISELPDDKLGDEVELFGMRLNYMSIILIIGGHANEHLGQLISYARSNDIVPPWSN